MQLLISILCLAACACAPALADVREAMSSNDTVAKCVGPDPVALYGFKPGCKETIVRAGQKSEMSYNKLGLRDADFPAKPRPGWTRILFIGPSSMAAPGIAAKEAPPKQLEALLRRKNKKVEVINAGVEGYANLQLAAITPALIKAYSPTHVVLYLNFAAASNTDLMNEPYAQWNEKGEVAMAYEIFPLTERLRAWKGWPPMEWNTRRRLLTIQSASSRAWRTLKCTVKHSNARARSVCLMESSMRAVRSIHKAASAAGARFLFLTDPRPAPNDLNVSPGQDIEYASRFDQVTPRNVLDPAGPVEILQGEGIHVIPLLAPGGQEYSLPGDYHFNARGALRFAEVVEAVLLEEFGLDTKKRK